MDITERELEDLIFEKLIKKDREYFHKVGLAFTCISLNGPVKPYGFYRQVPMGDYGRCDVLGIEVTQGPTEGIEMVNYSLIELKKGEITSDIIFQCLRYKNAIEKSISKGIYEDGYFEINIIGSSITKDIYKLIQLTLGDSAYVYTYDISIESGIKFNFINDASFFKDKCCENPCDFINSCNGSCFNTPEAGSFIYDRIKILSGKLKEGK